MRRLPVLAVLTTAFLLPLSGVAFADAEVTINDDGVSPESIKADVRETIVWTNASDADVSLVGKDPKWESGPIAPGATFSIEITKDGTYEYASEDGSIEGEIVVGQAGGATGGKDTEDDKTGGNDDKGGGKTDAKADDKNKADAEDNADETIDPDEEALPETGIDATLPGALSVSLIGLGSGLLRVTHSPRRRRKA